MPLNDTTKHVVFLLICFVFCVLYLMIGQISFSIHSIFHTLLKISTTFEEQFIIGDVRLPRLLVGSLCGALFAASGGLLQCALKNPMASPDILGVNAACMFFILLFTNVMTNPFHINSIYYSLLGAITGFLITLASSWGHQKTFQLRLIVIGIAVGALFKTFCQFIFMQSDERLSSLVAFFSGTLHMTNWHTVNQIFFPGILLLFLCFFVLKQMDIISLNDTVAHSIGFHVNFWKIIFIILALILAAIGISGSGGLGFVGLIAPNISKIFFGYSYKKNFIGTCYIGALLTCFADFLGRTVYPPFEIPAGLITIILGAPYFLYLMKSGVRHA